MTRSEFMQSLYSSLKGIDPEERYSIMEEYEMHFEDGLMDGKSEQQIASELGNPIKIGKEMRATSSIAKAQYSPNASNTANAVLSIIGLSMFNLFIVSVPLITYFSLLVSIIITAFFFILSPFFLLLDYMVNGASAVSWFEGTLVFGMFISGIALAFISYYLIKITNKLLIKYAKWNFDVVKRQNV